MGLRSSVSATCALALLVCGSDAWAAPCTGGNCPAATFVVTGIASPQSAGATSSVTVEVRTSAGVRATGYTGTIHFTSSDGQAVLPANYTFKSSSAATPNCTTGCDQGIHIFTNGVVLKTAATQSVTATDTSKSTDNGSQKGIVVQAQTASRLVVSGLATAAGRTAGTAMSPTVELKDAYGNRVTSYTGAISFSSSDPQAVLPASYRFTSGTGLDNGIHTFTNGVTLKTAGSQSVTATDSANGSVAGSESGIWVNPATTSILVVSGIASPQTPNTVSPFTVEARDGYGNRATAYAGTVKFTSTDAQAVLPANYKFTTGSGLDNGIHTFTPGVTLKTVGTQSVTATDTVNASITGTQTGIVVGSNAATTLVVSGVTSPQVAGSTSSIRVEARDAVGNIVPGYAGTVRISTTDAQATRPADHAFTPSDGGVYIFTGLVLRTAATHFVTATVVATSSITGTRSGVVVTPGAAAGLIVAAPSGVTAGVATDSTVTAVDTYGNVATSYAGTVHFTSSDPQATLATDYRFVTTDQGSHRFAGLFTLRTAGTQSLTATDTVTATIQGTKSDIAVAPGPAATLLVAGINAPLTAGGSRSLTVEVKDAFGNRATGYSGTVAFGSSDPQGTVPAPHSFTAADAGFFSASVILRTAGSQSVSAVDTVNGAIAGSLAGIVVNPASAVTLTLTGIPAAVTAGDSNAATVTAYDPYNNVASGYNGTVHFASSDPQATLPPDTMFLPADLGTHTICCVSLHSAGAQTVTVSDTLGGISTGSQTVAVTAGATSTLRITGIAAIGAGQPLSPSVSALDAYSNPTASYRGTVHFSSSDPQAILPADYAFTASDAGARTFLNALVLKTAGTRTITSTDTATASITGSASAPVAPGPAAALILTAANSAIAGSSFAVSVEARDVYANRAKGYTGTVSFSSSDPREILPAPYSFGAGDAGFKGDFLVVLKTVGSQTISLGDGALSVSSGTIPVGPGAAQSFIVSGFPNPTSSGVTGSITVEARDGFGNRATGYQGTVQFTSSNATVTRPAAPAFSAADLGIKTFPSLVLRTAGTQSITVTDGTIIGTQRDITVTSPDIPIWPSGSTLSASAASNTSAVLTWTGATDAPLGVSGYRLYKDGTLVQTITGSTLSTTVSGLTLGVQSAFQIQAGNSAGNWSLDGPMVTYVAVPPNPVLIAPAVDRSIPTTVFDSTSFIYTGPDAVQIGVASGTIAKTRAAAIRGTIHLRTGDPVRGARVTVENHPEYGWTLSRDDGAFDLVVNGGGPLVLVLERDGFLPVQRLVAPGWSEYGVVGDVVMVPYDATVNLINLSQTSVAQAAQGSVAQDANGARHATAIFPPGTSVTMTLQDGSTQSLSAMHVRATEYTVGPQASGDTQNRPMRDG